MRQLSEFVLLLWNQQEDSAGLRDRRGKCCRRHDAALREASGDLRMIEILGRQKQKLLAKIAEMKQISA
jgi:hypothetical protein